MHDYRVVDVFAERRYAGNPLTVVLDAGDLSADAMQAIANETNHSETTFVTTTAAVQGAWPVRIFTPARELPFAGHPTLGTAAVLRDVYGLKGDVTLDLKVGRVPVAPDGDLLWMTQPPASFGAHVDRDTLAACLSLTPAQMHPTLVPQVVSTGVPFIMAPLADRAALDASALDLKVLRRSLPATGSEAVYAFAPGGDAPHVGLSARSFTAAFGIPEDAATGSAVGALAAYAAEHGALGSATVDTVVAQGVKMGRPSFLHIAADATQQPVRVRVGGRVVPVASGRFL